MLLDERDRPVLEFARGVSLRVEVGDLLHLEGPLEGDRVVGIPADEEEGLTRVVLLREVRDRGIKVDRLLDPSRQELEVFYEGFVFIFKKAELVADVDREKIEDRDLGRVALGGRDRDLRAGPCVDRVVRELRDRAADHVHDREGAGAAGFAFFERRDRVGGLAGLGDHDEERVLIDQRIAVAELAREL